jgi:hypothetical protein
MTVTVFCWSAIPVRLRRRSRAQEDEHAGDGHEEGLALAGHGAGEGVGAGLAEARGPEIAPPEMEEKRGHDDHRRYKDGVVAHGDGPEILVSHLGLRPHRSEHAASRIVEPKSVIAAQLRGPAGTAPARDAALDAVLREQVSHFEPEVRELAGYCLDSTGKR